MWLSRVADRIYWAARYIERAEDTARLVRAHGELVADLPPQIKTQWEPLVAVVGSGVRYRDMVEDPAATIEGVCNFLGVAGDIVTRIPPVQVSIFAPRPANRLTGWARRFGPAGRNRNPGVDPPQRPELTHLERRSLVA